MRFLTGNKKLGPDVIHMSRPVGTTCPLSCAYHPKATGPHKNKCYKIRDTGRYQSVRNAAEENLLASESEITVALEGAAQNNQLVRLHVGGDFAKGDGSLDGAYTLVWQDAIAETFPRPLMLAYTHILDGWLPEVFHWFKEFTLFASVDNEDDVRTAQRIGFKRLALVMEEKHYEWDREQAWVERFGVRWLVCPVVRKKLPDCQSCQYCWKEWKHGGHVAFPEHSQPTREHIYQRNFPKSAEQANQSTGTA